ncbi:hemerythrin domain-containing protein [Thiomonas sp.]|uniref:hemerythrin domain-containing protein n=1 Tax=Thiomonas sp. TaxID=2047785 RepID=UPI002616C912|nr:hemerythrin domain-containing protein [Thiomonas sp.]
MPMSLLGGTSSAAGFDAPLALLSACHERIAKQCATLQRLPAHLAAHGADADAKQAASQILRYFETAGHHHHQDEELDVFPALREAVAGSDALCLRDMMARIAQEHRALDADWQRLRQQLTAVIAGDAAALDAADVAAFAARNQRHIAFEEGEFLPMAARLLDESQLRAIGQSMRARRSA